MNIIEAYDALRKDKEVVDCDLRLLTINESGCLCVKATGAYVAFSRWAMKDNSFHYAREFEHSPILQAQRKAEKQMNLIQTLKNLGGYWHYEGGRYLAKLTSGKVSDTFLRR